MKYELTTIVADEATTNPAPDLIAAHGGTITREDEIGTRRFAYPIGKLTNGVYTRFFIELDPSQTHALDAALRRDTAIVRHLIVVEGRESIAPAPTKVELSDADINAIGDVKEMQAAEAKAKRTTEKSTEDVAAEQIQVEEQPPAKDAVAVADEQPVEDVTVGEHAAVKDESGADEATRQAALDEKLKSILGK